MVAAWRGGYTLTIRYSDASLNLPGANFLSSFIEAFLVEAVMRSRVVGNEKCIANNLQPRSVFECRVGVHNTRRRENCRAIIDSELGCIAVKVGALP